MNVDSNEAQGLEIRPETISHEGRGIEVLALVGYLDGHTAPDLMRALDELLSETRNTILFDMTELQYMSSAGFGVLAATQKRAQEAGGDLKVMGLSSKIKRVFASLGLTNLIPSYDTRAEALASF